MSQKYIMILLVFSFFAAIFLSIGYAKTSGDLIVQGDVSLRSQQGIVITKVNKVRETGNVSSHITNYVGTVLTTSITLDQVFNSNIIYEVKVTNTTKEDYLFSEVLYDSMNDFNMYSNAFIIPSVLNHDEYPMDDMISLHDILPAGGTKSFYVSYHYDTLSSSFDGVISSDMTDLYGMVHYKFIPMHSLSYENISIELPSEIIDGADLLLDFSEVKPIRLEIIDLDGNVYEEGTDYIYSDYQLVISKVHSSLLIKGLDS